MAPFLLFSLRENDSQWWRSVLLANPQKDLLAPPDSASTALRALQSAAVGFVWQLARRNPYVARIITGSSPGWCELLAEQPLITLLGRVGSRSDLLISRLENSYNIDTSLLADGASSRAVVRQYSHLVTLQSLLTDQRQPLQPLASAACSLTIPSEQLTANRQVSDKKV